MIFYFCPSSTHISPKHQNMSIHCVLRFFDRNIFSRLVIGCKLCFEERGGTNLKFALYTVPPFISLMRVEARVVEVYVYIYYTLQSPFVYKFDEKGSMCG